MTFCIKNYIFISHNHNSFYYLFHCCFKISEHAVEVVVGSVKTTFFAIPRRKICYAAYFRSRRSCSGCCKLHLQRLRNFSHCTDKTISISCTLAVHEQRDLLQFIGMGSFGIVLRKSPGNLIVFFRCLII